MGINQPETWRTWWRLGAGTCGLAVILGAFGAHALEGVIHEWYEADRAATKLDSWETGVRYQFYHGIGLLVVGFAWTKTVQRRLLCAAAVLFVAGMLVFCGGLYLWVLTDLKPFVVAVPLGGGSLIGGWICLALCPFAGPPGPSASTGDGP